MGDHNAVTTKMTATYQRKKKAPSLINWSSPSAGTGTMRDQISATQVRPAWCAQGGLKIAFAYSGAGGSSRSSSCVGVFPSAGGKAPGAGPRGPRSGVKARRRARSHRWRGRPADGDENGEIDRCLKGAKVPAWFRGQSHTEPGSLLKSQMPIRPGRSGRIPVRTLSGSTSSVTMGATALGSSASRSR
jgi:hypothetical protein